MQPPYTTNGKKFCVRCEGVFPATPEFFYVLSANRKGHRKKQRRLDSYCRPCRLRMSNEYNHRLREQTRWPDISATQ